MQQQSCAHAPIAARREKEAIDCPLRTFSDFRSPTRETSWQGECSVLLSVTKVQFGPVFGHFAQNRKTDWWFGSEIWPNLDCKVRSGSGFKPGLKNFLLRIRASPTVLHKF